MQDRDYQLPRAACQLQLPAAPDVERQQNSRVESAEASPPRAAAMQMLAGVKGMGHWCFCELSTIHAECGHSC